MSIFRDAVKKDTFLHRYLEYMSPLETPVAYDFWCGLWLISTAIGRRIVVNRPKAPVYLNLYTVLCADAGTTRKSTAIRLCENVFRAAGFDKSCVFITGGASPEKLTEQLSLQSATTGTANGAILVSELVTFLGKENYTIAMPGLLTDLYDCPSYRDYTRISTGNRTITNAFVSFASASTPSWLVRAINPDVIEGGFTSRCIFVIEEKRKRMVAWPDDTGGIQPSDLAEPLLHIRAAAERWSSKGISLTPNARARFVRWYENRTDSGGSDPFVASFEAREDHHILRLAALLAANDDSWTIDVFHINHAIKIIGHHKNSAAALFGSSKESLRLVNGIDKLRTVLTEGGEMGLSQTEVLFKTRAFLKSRELEYALATMHELEMVQRFEVSTAGRRKTIWRATNKILARNLNELVKERLTNG